MSRWKNRLLNSQVSFCASCLTCLTRSVLERVGSRSSFQKEQELCFVLWSDCVAQPGHLSCTCLWPSIPTGQIFPSITRASKTLHSACLPAARLAAASQTLGKWAVTDLESDCWIPTLHALSSVWFWVARGDTDSQHSSPWAQRHALLLSALELTAPFLLPHCSAYFVLFSSLRLRSCQGREKMSLDKNFFTDIQVGTIHLRWRNGNLCFNI